MCRESVLDRSDCLVIGDVHRFVAGAVALPVIPCSHQGVLEYGKLVVVAADVVEQAKNQARSDISSTDGNRTRYSGTKFVASHSRYKILSFVHSFRQAGEFHAVPDEVGSHRNHDKDRNFILLYRL